MACLSLTGPAKAEDAASSVLVRTQAVRQGSLPQIVTAFGTAGPAQEVGTTVAVQQEGRVAQIAVTPGEAVRQGDTLLVFAPTSAARAGYRQAMTALSLAQGERARTAQLLSQHLATRDQLAQADKALSDAQGALDVLTREGGGTPQTVIRAAFDAIIATIPVAQGDRVAAGTPLMTLSRADGLVVTVGAEPADRARVRPGQQAHLLGLSDEASLTGRVLRIDAALNAKTRLIDIDIAIPAGAVLSGAAYQAAIEVGTWSGWVVPHAAVLLDDRAGVLFQVHGGKAVRVPVQVLGSDGRQDVVQGKLDPADRLVVEGNAQLDDGTAVREGAADGEGKDGTP